MVVTAFSGVNASARLGDEVPMGVGCGDGVSPPPKIFLFCDVEMAYFGLFCGAKLKVCNDIGEIFSTKVPQNIGGDVSPASPAVLTPVTALAP